MRPIREGLLRSMIRQVVLPYMLALSTCLSCSDAQIGERDAWLSSTFIKDHLHLISRSPELVSGKFKKMTGLYLDGSTPLYPYMRGSLAQMYRDLSGEYLSVVPSRFSSSEGLLTLLVGDPHIENVSSLLNDSGELSLDWDDFDSAGYGPWIWDLRRLALSWWVFAYDLGDHSLSRELINAVSSGYQEGVKLWRAGRRERPREGTLLPTSIRDLFLKRRESAAMRRSLGRYTESTGSQRVLKRGEIRSMVQEGVWRDVLLSLTSSEFILTQGLVNELTRQQSNLGALKDQARKFGQGISSYPLMRFYLLFEGSSDRLDDDEIWEAKELADRPAPPGLPLYPSRRFGAQGERVLNARRSLQWVPPQALNQKSPHTWIDVGNMSFRLRRINDLQGGLNTDDLIKQWRSAESEPQRAKALDEYEHLAHLLGRLLAGAHCYAETLNGIQGGEVVEADLLEGGSDRLTAELLEFVEAYGPQIELDRAFLVALLSERGPLLGMKIKER